MSNSVQAKKAALGAFIGTTIEFYDFYIYATAAALVLGHVFFPAEDPLVSTLAAFASFAVGFIARPLAGVVFGHLGDKLGRRKMLLFTMMLMGLATTAIGLIPGYDKIGIWAPILLVTFRIVQGISVGGEWGGAVLMASEHAPHGRKTFFASFAQLGSPAGLLLSLIAFRLVSMLDQEAFLSWGWRLPFLASGVLMMVGLFIRMRVDESPEFETLKAKRELADNPVIDALKHYFPHIFFSAIAVTIGSAGFFFTNIFMITYVTQYIGIAKSTILDCLFVVTIIQLISQPASALLANKIGEGRFLKIAAALCLITPYPMFILVDTKNLLLMTLGIAVAVVILSALYAVVAGYMVSVFPTRLRYSGISISYQLICAIAGGTTPLIGTVIAKNYAGQWLPLALFFSLLSALSLLGVIGLSRLKDPTSASEAELLESK